MRVGGSVEGRRSEAVDEGGGVYKLDWKVLTK